MHYTFNAKGAEEINLIINSSMEYLSENYI